MLQGDDLRLILKMALPIGEIRFISPLIDATRLRTFTSVSWPPLNTTFSGPTRAHTDHACSHFRFAVYLAVSRAKLGAEVGNP